MAPLRSPTLLPLELVRLHNSTATPDSLPSEQHIPISTSSLDALQSDEQRQVLNIVDSLRQCGLEGIVSLPQLVVCGDQSSGKSSVLEAITEIPFPRRENLCTRFATEIVLRRAPTPSIKTRIIAEKTRPKQEQAELERFRESISDFRELPDLIDKATKLMGLAGAGDQTRNAFARDVLSIEISGPDRPQLTLVDLPGLIHSENKAQSSDDVQLVSDLVEGYISNPRTIILAIVSAKNDYANQIILKRAREFDKKGSRTLGIITKPDDLHPDSGNETAFINLAQNEDIFFALGWHVLKNRGFTDRHHSFDQRNQSERAFLSKGNWQKLPSDMLGIEPLRVRLSDLLFRHIKQELPKLREELDQIYEDTLLGLQALGRERSAVHQQKEYLMQLSLQFYDLTKAGVNGHYESDYFGTVDTGSNFSSTLHERRLRAAVQLLNVKFAKAMCKLGHKYKFEGLVSLEDDESDGDADTPASGVGSDQDEAEAKLDRVGSPSFPGPKVLCRSKALSWVKTVLIRTRGRELPGNFNPLLIGELFWEQSENWQGLAEHHLDDVSILCSNFVIDLLRDICPVDVSSRVQASIVEESLKRRLEAGEAELKKLLQDRKRYPMTYNHYYTLTIQKMRRERSRIEFERCLKDGTSTSSIYDINRHFVEVPKVDQEKVVRDFNEKMELDMDNHSSSEALDDLYAFYKVGPL
jgi:GTPase SAR1 family protein